MEISHNYNKVVPNNFVIGKNCFVKFTDDENSIFVVFVEDYNENYFVRPLHQIKLFNFVIKKGKTDYIWSLLTKREDYVEQVRRMTDFEKQAVDMLKDTDLFALEIGISECTL